MQAVLQRERAWQEPDGRRNTKGLAPMDDTAAAEDTPSHESMSDEDIPRENASQDNVPEEIVPETDAPDIELTAETE